jgi:hypothetical protein
MDDRAYSPDQVDDMPEVSCIYEIRNLKDGRRYVGQAVNFRQRSREHVRLLDAGMEFTNREGLLQKAWITYGRDVFVFRILEAVVDNRHKTRYEVRPDNLNLAEHYHINKNAEGDYNKDKRIVRDSFKALIDGKAWREPIDEATMSRIRAVRPRPYLVGKRRGFANAVIVLGFNVDDAKRTARVDAGIAALEKNLSTMRLSEGDVQKWLRLGAKDLRSTRVLDM